MTFLKKIGLSFLITVGFCIWMAFGFAALQLSTRPYNPNFPLGIFFGFIFIFIAVSVTGWITIEETKRATKL